MIKHQPLKKNGLTSIAIITVLALIIVLPAGAIPGVPAVVALLIIFIAIQCAVGLKKRPLPARGARLSIERRKMNAMIDKSRPTLLFIDRFIQPRLVFMCNRMMEWIIAVVCIVLALTFFPWG